MLESQHRDTLLPKQQIRRPSLDSQGNRLAASQAPPEKEKTPAAKESSQTPPKANAGTHQRRI
jgi:hypothetical protein